MRRRALLALSGGTLAGLAGCGQISGSDGTATSTRTQTRTGAGTETATESPPQTDSSAGDGRIEISSKMARHLIRTVDLPPARRAITDGDIAPEESIPPTLKDALLEALDGEFETRDPAPELLAAIDAFRHVGVAYRFEPYVRIDGIEYAFDPTVPVFVATLHQDADDPDPERTAHYRADVETDEVSAFVQTVAGLGPSSPRDEYRMSIVPDALSTFLDRYDYLETPHGVGRIATERVDPGPPCTISIAPLTDEDLWGHQIVDTAELPADLRATLLEAVTSDRRKPALSRRETEHRTDRLPDEFGAVFEADEDPLVRRDETVYSVSAFEPNRARLPVELSIETVSADGDERPAFAVTATAVERASLDGRVGLRSSGALPSVLWIETGSDRYLLGSDVHDAIDWTETEAGGRSITNEESTELAVGESMAARYAVPDAVPDGTYDVWGLLNVSWDDPYWRGIPYPFQVVVEVDRR